MKTTAELISFIGCDSCSDYASCDIKDHCRWKACAERLESQEKKIEAYRKKIYEDTERISKIDELEQEIEKLKWDNAALEATVENQRKQMEDEYMPEQFVHDCDRIHEGKKEHEAHVDIPMTDKEFVENVKSWAASHPENPKMTNGDKFEEVFGGESYCVCFRPKHTDCMDTTGNTTCASCDYGYNGEYKAPSDK